MRSLKELVPMSIAAKRDGDEEGEVVDAIFLP